MKLSPSTVSFAIIA